MEGSGDLITLDKARRIASEWHDGQPSRLYSFASTGYRYFPITDYLDEINTCVPESELDQAELDALADFLDHLPREMRKARH